MDEYTKETSQRDATCKACMMINDCVIVSALEGIPAANGDYTHLETQTRGYINKAVDILIY